MPGAAMQRHHQGICACGVVVLRHIHRIAAALIRLVANMQHAGRRIGLPGTDRPLVRRKEEAAHRRQYRSERIQRFQRAAHLTQCAIGKAHAVRRTGRRTQPVAGAQRCLGRPLDGVAQIRRPCGIGRGRAQGRIAIAQRGHQRLEVRRVQMARDETQRIERIEQARDHHWLAHSDQRYVRHQQDHKDRSGGRKACVGGRPTIGSARQRGVAQPGQRACFGYRRSWVQIPPPRPVAARGVMRARIYQPPKNAMQSGWAATHEWVLEFEPSSPRRPDPLMGWIGSADTQAQVRLSFPTREEAVAYAERNGIAYDLELPQPRRVQAEGLCRQFPLRPDRELDALTARHRRPQPRRTAQAAPLPSATPPPAGTWSRSRRGTPAPRRRRPASAASRQV